MSALPPARWFVTAMLLALSACASRDPSSSSAASELLGPELQAWSERSLPGKLNTHYSLGSRAGRSCVLAHARRSASMLRRPLQVEPSRLGQVEFDWWIASGVVLPQPGHDDPPDDAPVRLLLAFEGDDAKLSLRNRMVFELARAMTGEAPPYATLMYIWHATAAPETVIISSHTDRIRKIVVGSGEIGQRSWQRFRRDIAADFRRAFGEEPGPLVQTALMTDADNSQGQAEACYGRLIFLDPERRTLPGSLLF